MGDSFPSRQRYALAPERTRVTGKIFPQQMPQVRKVQHALAAAAANKPFLAWHIKMPVEHGAEDVFESARHLMPVAISAPTDREMDMSLFIARPVETKL